MTDLRAALVAADAAETHYDAMLILRRAVSAALAATPPASAGWDAVDRLIESVRQQGGVEYAEHHRHGFWWEGVQWALDALRAAEARE